MSPQEDRRIRRTKRILRNSLIELLTSKDLNEITVSELTNHADVNRGTFYSHYQDVYDLFKEIEQGVLDDLLGILMPVFSSPQTWRAVLRESLMYMQDRGKVFSIILSSTDSAFYDKIISRLHAVIKDVQVLSFSNEKREYNEYLYVYCITGIINVMQSWHKRDYIHPIEEMAELTETLILRTFPDLKNI